MGTIGRGFGAGGGCRRLPVGGGAVSSETLAFRGRPDRVMPTVPVPMPAEPEFLFVYGTLRVACAPAAVVPLVRGLERAGPATMRGDLHDLGPYPAMVAGDGLVHGDLLRVTDPAQLGPLDAYEACDGPEPLYRRAVGRAHRGDGTDVNAWVYLYARPLNAAPLIPGGDYARRHGGPP